MSKNWCFTINNYTVEDDHLLQNMPYAYLLYGKEVGEQGTPHYQGYVQFLKRYRLTGLKKLHPKAHWTIAKGSSLDNHTYCTKDHDYQEFGIIRDTLGAAAKGVNSMVERIARNQRMLTAPFDDLIASGDIHPNQIRGLKNAISDIKEQRNRLNPPKRLDGELHHLWYWGEAGTGKSVKAQDDHPNAYHKNANKWWCGYDGEDVVIIEDFDKRHEKLAYHLKLWADRYPFPAEIKGGSLGKIRPKIIVITSNYHPRDIWPESQDLKPIERRFNIVHFPDKTPFTQTEDYLYNKWKNNEELTPERESE